MPKNKFFGRSLVIFQNVPSDSKCEDDSDITNINISGNSGKCRIIYGITEQKPKFFFFFFLIVEKILWKKHWLLFDNCVELRKFDPLSRDKRVTYNNPYISAENIKIAKNLPGLAGCKYRYEIRGRDDL